MTKEEFLNMWEAELEKSEEEYREQQARVNKAYENHRNGIYQRGRFPKSPDYTMFRNRLSSRLYI